LTHGFVLDEKGAKMSKSLGNVVDPRVVIEGGKDQKKDPPFGADVLRLWVASSDYSSDVMVGPGILKQTAEGYRKVRGTLRFLLGNLDDFDPSAHEVPYASLPAIDQYVLFKLGTVIQEASSAFEAYQFSRIFQVLQRFVVADLSNFYLDVAKDRLYIRSGDDSTRRSCQTVLHAVLRGLLSICAPLAPHLAEDAWLNMPKTCKTFSDERRKSKPGSGPASVFQAGWATVEPEWMSLSKDQVALWASVATIRESVNATLEKARIDKAIGSSLDARVLVHVSSEALRSSLVAMDGKKNGVDDLRYLFIVSQGELVADASLAKLAPYSETYPLEPGASPSDAAESSVTVGVARASGAKCARCWNYSEQVSSTSQAAASGHPELCERCGPVITKIGFKPATVAVPA
jgi:isoleucyl-tRNA synthetase